MYKPQDVNNTIIITRCDDGAIWVTSDTDPFGIELSFEDGMDIKEQFLIAMAKFLGYDIKDIKYSMT